MNPYWVLGTLFEVGSSLHRPGVEYETARVVHWDAPNRIVTLRLDSTPVRDVTMYDMAYRDLNMGVPRIGQRVVVKAVLVSRPSFVLVGFSLLEDEG